MKALQLSGSDAIGIGLSERFIRSLPLLVVYCRRQVFAMVSGLGRDDWAPVHRFCTTLGLPCLLPNVDLPGSDQESAHNFYLSRGGLLDSAHWHAT